MIFKRMEGKMFLLYEYNAELIKLERKKNKAIHGL